MERQQVSQLPGAEGCSYGGFRQDHESESISVPSIRQDGRSEFTGPEIVNDPADLRDIAVVAIAAPEKWEGLKGLGA